MVRTECAPIHAIKRARIARLAMWKEGQVEPISAEELVQWCQRTLPYDQRAFEVLVTQYQSKVFRTAYRLLDNRQDAEDVAQDVFIKVHRGIRSLDEPTTLPAWIHRITTNACLDVLAQQRRRPAPQRLETQNADGQPLDWTIEAFPDGDTETPEESALSRELRQCIETTLAQLQPIERAALVLRDIEDRPYQEIADSLRVGLSALKMRIHRARLAFQKLFDTICPELRSSD